MSRPSSSAANPGGSDDITVTARLVIPRDKANKLEEWIQHEFMTVQARVPDDYVLYAASRDGFSNDLFHDQCDGKSPTVVFVILSNKRIFGGYTSVPWTSENRPVADPKAFLFSLSDGQEREALILPLLQHKGFAVNHYRDRGPLFGVGCGSDLGLTLDEDKLHLSRSNVGMTYAIPQRSAREPLVSDTLMAGSLDNWDIQDVVVYHCKPKPMPDDTISSTP